MLHGFIISAFFALYEKITGKSTSDSKEGAKAALWLLIITVAFMAVLFSFVFSSSDTTPDDPPKSPRITLAPISTATSTPKPTSSLADYYKSTYPMTWGYILKNSTSPYTYIYTYDNIWGDLQRYHGDGILFSTLSPYEQSLVNYPAIANSVYFSSSTSSTYHSIPYCYTLLGSQLTTRSAQYRNQYSPCSKCVGE